jgi:hypothetical protein
VAAQVFGALDVGGAIGGTTGGGAAGAVGGSGGSGDGGGGEAGEAGGEAGAEAEGGAGVDDCCVAEFLVVIAVLARGCLVHRLRQAFDAYDGARAGRKQTSPFCTSLHGSGSRLAGRPRHPSGRFAFLPREARRGLC